HLAVASGSAEAVAVLLEHGANLEARETAWDQTPLMWAAAYNHVEVLKTLLRAGADASAASKVEDIGAREKADAEDEKRRNQRMAALWGLSRPLDEAERETQRIVDLAETSEAERARRAAEKQPLSYGELVGNKGGLTPLL